MDQHGPPGVRTCVPHSPRSAGVRALDHHRPPAQFDGVGFESAAARLRAMFRMRSVLRHWERGLAAQQPEHDVVLRPRLVHPRDRRAGCRVATPRRGRRSPSATGCSPSLPRSGCPDIVPFLEVSDRPSAQPLPTSRPDGCAGAPATRPVSIRCAGPAGTRDADSSLNYRSAATARSVPSRAYRASAARGPMPRQD
jgi:hypothetical protein